MDVLTGLKRLQICVGYELNGTRIDSVPADDLDALTPIYEELEGWEEDLGSARDIDELPAAARAYLARIEELVHCPVTLVSVGPGRAQTIAVTDPFATQK
jgi:adenylosuccinate synthase